MEKEPLKESSRFKVFIASVIFETLLLGAGWASANYGWNIPTELLEQVSLVFGGLVVSFLFSRTYRNSASK